ncbi:Chitinase II [Penicillium occitanis (nom. inval.)]|nr:Chitinase II [Penicillium occitanis (nom. inval.)]PCH07449.1 hypothetical protein PENOC_018990 [Penicillium occitanis (nom. inval.)]
MSRFVLGLWLLFALQLIEAKRCIMYLTGQHDVVPEINMVQDVTHVIMAFMHSSAFNVPGATEWRLFSTVEEVRSKFVPGTAVMIAIGGWGDMEGFSKAAATPRSRKLFAQNIRKMIRETGADGVDIDWEYPGGNGDDYKRIQNFEKIWEIDAYPKLLAEIRNALGPKKLISAAVPGLQRDMIAFTEANLHQLDECLDFLNIMTYDLMNRRDNVTRHHTGVQLSREGLKSYLNHGIASSKANLGFAFYIKWIKTDPGDDSRCLSQKGIGCKTMLLEDPVTGADLGLSGSFSWHDPVPPELAASFNKAMMRGSYDSHGGGQFFWDQEENIFWTWDTPDAIRRKFPFPDHLFSGKKNCDVKAEDVVELGQGYKNFPSVVKWPEPLREEIE